MQVITVYSKLDCPLCDKAIAKISTLQSEFTFKIKVVDIYQDDELLEKYQIMIPVVVSDGVEIDFGQISENKVKSYLQAKIGEF
ncbi:glutaredoxin family protein [Bacillus suaedae]|uniref:Glutaredoxin family protein n=1 Tax=Halalkalibacter suaedae TaxID=2822140 RepID=A0A940WXC8_9BACI|nr:glutaredoxin family protein [Bacillus suaedae]MBP3949965.1 glutaredoxin family protein [Bacillus suaedae]